MPLLISCMLAALVACIPESTGIDSSYEVQDARIVSVWTSWNNDTIPAGVTPVLLARYLAGSPDCFAYLDSSLTRTDSILFLRIRQNAFTKRTCLDLLDTINLEIDSDSLLPPGSYWVYANFLGEDTLKYHFTQQ